MVIDLLTVGGFMEIFFALALVVSLIWLLKKINDSEKGVEEFSKTLVSISYGTLKNEQILKALRYLYKFGDKNQADWEVRIFAMEKKG